MDDRERLAGLVATWWQAVHDFTALLERLPEEAWRLPTDLPAWDVHDVAAHTAHLEGLLAGAEHDDVEIGTAEHARGVMGRFTEQGVVARRRRSPDDLINEIRSAATARHTRLLADPPADPTVPAPGVFGLMGWTTERLLRNRPLDVWMHEQDVRRAVGRPGGLDSPAAAHSADYLGESLGFVVGKRVAAPEGTTVVLEVSGSPVRAVRMVEGRARPLDEPPASPTVLIRTDRESFIVLAGGRREPPAGAVAVSGDRALGDRVVAALAVTP